MLAKERKEAHVEMSPSKPACSICWQLFFFSRFITTSSNMFVSRKTFIFILSFFP